MNYRADIDGLRAISVLSVILFHLGIVSLSGGFVGVDVFFVISGYVIAKSLEKDLADGRFSLLRFYNKRIRRIFPALFAMLAAVWLAALVVLLPAYFLNFSKSLLAASAFASNIYFWREWGYFSPDSITKPLLHTWSLAVEEQYYIFAPILTWAVYRFFKRNWLAVLGPAALISLLLSIYATEKAPTADFFLLPGRAWELLLGALLAHRPPPLPRSRGLVECFGALGLGLIAYAVFTFSRETPFPGVAALYPCVGAALLIYAGQSPTPTLASRALSHRVMTWCGKISYSLYLVHWPLIVFFYYTMLGPPKTSGAFLILGASFAISYLSWRFVEQPFRRPGTEWRTKNVIGGGLLIALVFALAGIAGMRAQGFPSRFPDYASPVIADSQHLHWNSGTCFTEDDLGYQRWDLKKCTIIKGGQKRVLLWGDSHAAHYVPGLLAAADKIPYTVIQYNGGACPPVALTGNAFNVRACRGFNENAFRIIRDDHIDIVILSARWANHRAKELAGLSDTLARLDKMGVKVFVIGQTPEFAVNPDVLYYYRKKRGLTPLDRADINFDPKINDSLAAIAGRDRFIDPLKTLCQGTLCLYRNRDNLLFEDTGHYSDAGSILAVQTYFPLIVHRNEGNQK